MGRFRYQRLDQDGHRVESVIEADSLHEASEKLRAAEIPVVSIERELSDSTRYEPDGQRPGSAPRDVQVRIRDMAGGWVLAIVGGIFTAVSSIFVVVGLGLLLAGERTGLFLALFPLIHLTIGVGMLVYVLRGRRRRERIYNHGEVAMATIDGVGYNRSVRVNGKNPFEMTWSFDVDGHRYHDKRSSFDERVLTFATGDRMWVLYDPYDPESSVEWPPLAR